jgi:hypothetical protein
MHTKFRSENVTLKWIVRNKVGEYGLDPFDSVAGSVEHGMKFRVK